MKERISATIDPNTKNLIENLLKSSKYRNMSHVIEKAIEMLEKAEKKSK
jgi:Arc/MetJ-type ribon-helix-helix transcriptional regulator